MNRYLQAMAGSLRFFHSPLVTRLTATRSLQLTCNQVTHSSLHTYPPPPTFADRSNHYLHFPTIHHKHFFSSKPNPILELILFNDWSQGLELELDKFCPSLTHETVLYVLKRLDKNPEKASCFFNWVCEKQWFRPSSSLYSLIVRILAHKETREQFWITLDMMKRNGFLLDKETYLPILASFKRDEMNNDSVALTHFYNRMTQENARGSVVNKVVVIVSMSEWGNEVKDKLGELKIKLSDNFVARVLKELRNCPLKAYEFFRWAGEQSNYEQNTVTYNAIARTLAGPDTINEFWSIIEEMMSVCHGLDIDTYVKVSRKLQKSKMVEDSVKLYELMMDGPYKPSVQDCAMLLKSISECDAPNLELVFRVAKKYESMGHSLSKEIYDGIHRSLTGAGKFDEAENIVKSMRNAGYELDNVTYSQLVFGLCKRRRLEEACKVLEEMKSCGCIPDIRTWTILIRGHCAANEIDKALRCLDRMIEMGCNPGAAVLGALVDSFLSQKRIEDAYKLLVTVVRKIVTSPWQGTYKKLIENLLGIGKFEEALDLACLMKKHKYHPFTEPFVQYVSKFGTVEDAAKFLKSMGWSKGSPQSRSAHLQVLESFLREGRESEARDLLGKCRPYITKDKKIHELFGSGENGKAATSWYVNVSLPTP